MTGKAVQALVFKLDDTVNSTSSIYLNPEQIDAWREEMKNWSTSRFCEYYNGLAPVARERFMFILWHSFHIGTAHTITDAIFGAAAADSRESKMRAERDAAQRELWTAQQETLAVRAEKEAQTRQKANRIIELEADAKGYQARIAHMQDSIDSLTENRSDLMQDVLNERTAHLRTKAQLEAAEGATKTLARLLAVADGQ